MNRLFSFLVPVLASLWLAGCATAPKVAEIPKEPLTQAPEYVIGPNDQVQIFVWGNEELSATVPVRPDGRITTPLVEDLQAAGKTPTQLARDMEKALATYVKNPIVTVIVTGFSGLYDDQIRVVGQAAKPQALPYRASMTLLDVLIAVGGLTEYAAGNRAVVLRREGDHMKRIPVRLDDLLNGGDIRVNMPMRPGDILVIPEAWF
ncbi:MAG: sugar ABC transporter substrate-binding protein [Gammaproteobacteria bacterium]|nr:MAG: sugar ABC transporter substrate-binding protein [Gammaproteobacteria bacterium]